MHGLFNHSLLCFQVFDPLSGVAVDLIEQWGVAPQASVGLVVPNRSLDVSPPNCCGFVPSDECFDDRVATTHSPFRPLAVEQQEGVFSRPTAHGVNPVMRSGAELLCILGRRVVRVL